jgi:phosphate acetyltransferase
MNPGSGNYERLLERCAGRYPVTTAVAHPCEKSTLEGALEASAIGLIAPILVGPAQKLRQVAKASDLKLDGFEIVDTPHSHASSAKAVALIREGRAELLMKGSLHTDELLPAVIARDTGLRTGRRLSHAFIMDVPAYHKVMIVTDAAINIAPTLEEKVDICQNAIDLAITLGVEKPKVAILAAVEAVNSKMSATLDAAALCKRADRGQITGGILDGPLAFDNAITTEATKIKGIRSDVAGDPDCATKEIGALAAVLGGIDGIVFTAGIGENSPEIRRRICDSSAWLGIEFDPEANARNGPRISIRDSRVAVWVIPTNEEMMIVWHTGLLLGLIEAHA